METNKIEVPRIGQPWPGQGGIYAGVMRGENGKPDYHLIVPTDKKAAFKSVAWGAYGNDIAGANSDRDGVANTIAMVEADSDVAKQIRALEIDGHSDFYLMSRHEARLCYINVPELFESAWYWTSTQCSSDHAWCQAFTFGIQGSVVKGFKGRARAVRRFEIF